MQVVISKGAETAPSTAAAAATFLSLATNRCRLYSWRCHNKGAAIIYVQVYDIATGAVPGSATGFKYVTPVPIGATVGDEFATGMPMENGCVLFLSVAAAGQTAITTAADGVLMGSVRQERV